MTPSQATMYNNSNQNGAYMYNVGSKENPEFLYPSELEPSIVTASDDAWRRKQIELQVAKMMGPRRKYVEQIIPEGFDKFKNNVSNLATKFAHAISNPVDIVLGQLNRHEIVDRSSGGLSVHPTVVDLTSNAYAANSDEITSGTDLFNEFTEMTNPNIHIAKKWSKLSPNYLLTDGYNIPLKDISLFQGVENGTYKIAPLGEFESTTTVVPVRGTGVSHPRLVGADWHENRPRYMFENDSTSFSPGFSNKGTIGNINGGLFVNKPDELDSTQVAQINNFLQQFGPSYATLQDSGSNSQYETKPGNEYSDQGVGYQLDNTMIFGKHVK